MRWFKAVIFKNAYEVMKSAVTQQYRWGETLEAQHNDVEKEQVRRLLSSAGRIVISDFQRYDLIYGHTYSKAKAELDSAGLTWGEVGLDDFELKTIGEIEFSLGIEE
jgi:hypothetical protein